MLSRVPFFIIAGILIAIPLFFWQGVFFPYTFIKTVLFYVLTQTMFLVWLFLALQDETYRPRYSLVATMIVTFLAVLAIASFTGVDISKSIWSDYERMFGLITWLHLGIFFLVASSVLRAERDRNLLLITTVGTAFIVALYAVWQGLTTADLSISTIGNAAYLSSYLVPSIFLALLLLFREKTFSLRAWGYSLVIAGMGFAIIFTQARAGVVGLAAGFGIASLLFLFLGEKTGHTFSIPNLLLKKLLVVLLVVGSLFTVSSIVIPARIAPFIPDNFEQLVDFSPQERTANARILVWQVAWSGWKEHFLLGGGPENFNVLFNTHYIPELYTVEPWFDRAHNFIFEYGTAVGLAGLLAYIGMFGVAVFSIIHQWKNKIMPFWSMVMLIALLVAHLTQNLFTFDTLSSILLLFFVFAYIATKNQHTEMKRPQNNHNRKNYYTMPFMILTTLVLAISMYMVALKPLLANATAHKGWELLRTGGGDEAAIMQFEKSLSYTTQYSVDTRRFMAEYVFEFLKQGGQRPDASLRRLMEYSIEKMTQNIEAEPRNVKWVMYRGQLYSLFAQKFTTTFAAQAEADFLQAKTMSSGRPQIYLELAQARRLQGDSAGAWEYIYYVTETTPDFIFGHLNAVVLAIETGDQDREQQALAALSDHGELDSEVVRDAYFKVQRYRDAAAIQELIVAIASQNLDDYTTTSYALLYAHLAALYQYAGEIQKARETALLVKDLDPARTGEVEAFLKTLE